jgi:hypothetical protein
LRTGKLIGTSRGLKLDFKQFVYPAKLALTIYLVAMVSVIGQTFFLKREASKKDEVLLRSVKGVIGGATNYLETLMANPERLKVKLKEKENEFQTKGAGVGSSSTLDLIQELTKGLPSGAKMQVSQFELIGNKLTLKIDAASQADAEKATTAFQALPVLQNAKSGPMEAGKGARKKITITSTVAQRKGV